MKIPSKAEIKSSWTTIWTLIKIQFKAGVKLPRGKNKGMTALKLGLLLGAVIVGIVGFNFVYGMLADQFIEAGLAREFLVFTFVIFNVLQTCFMLPMLIRTLDINNDREMLLRWPVSPKQIFISKIIVAYFNEVIFAAVILGPILIAYGAATGMNVGLYFLLPFVILVAPLFPFFLASLVMSPVQRIVNYLRSRQMLTTFIYFGLLVGMILGYMELVNGTLFALISQDGIRITLAANASTIQTISQVFALQWLFAMIFTGGALWAFLGLFLVILICFVLMCIGLFCAGRNYYKTYMDERTTFSAVKKKAPYKQSKPLYATIRKDCLNIFRSSNYTFQFLLLVVLTPLLVYFCNRVAMEAAFQTFHRHNPAMSMDLIFGASLFVILILMPVSSSFAASAITREGHNIYHTKLIPVSFRRQLAIKAGIVFFPILLSATVAVAMILIPYQPTGGLGQVSMRVDTMDALYIFGLAVFMAIGYICLGMYLDLRKPLCNQVGGAELVKSTAHINVIMAVGLVVGVLLGVIAMFGELVDTLSGLADLGFMVEAAFRVGAHARAIYLPLAGAFAAVSLFLLFVVGPKKYYRLEQ